MLDLNSVARELTHNWIAVAIAGGCVSFVSLYFLSKLLQPSMSYEGKHVLVTGGSAGIGLDIAKEYARSGANVTIVARNLSKLQQAQKELQQSCKPGRKVCIAAVDVGSSLESVVSKLAPAIAEQGEVDVLINNAGTSVSGTFDSVDVKEFSNMFNVNVIGSVNVTRAVLAGMKTRPQGRIVFVSSQVAQAALYGYTAYAASKWALRGLAEALQMEVRPFNILVSVAFPPDTNTPGYEVEMQTKPEILRKLSESGSVFSSQQVAKDIHRFSTIGYFNISTGLDGWLLRMLHPGMSPINNVWEAVQPIAFAPIARTISIFYVAMWNAMCLEEHNKNRSQGAGAGLGKKAQ